MPATPPPPSLSFRLGQGTVSAGRIAGIAIRVHWLLLLALGLLLADRGWRDGAESVISLATLLALAIVSLLIHELGHALAARRHQITVPAIVLGPFVNMAWLAQEPDSPRVERNVALAGPLANGALLLILAPLASWITHEATREQLTRAVWINALMCLGNLVPAFPLDGARVLRAFLSRRHPYLIATRLAIRIGTTVVLCIPLLALLQPRVRDSWMLLGATALIVVALLRSGRQEEKRALCRELRLQFGRDQAEVSPDLHEKLREYPMPREGHWTSLSGGQFRRWREACEAAFRNSM